METKFISLIACTLLCGWAAMASAEDKAGSVVSIRGMPRQQFEALAPDVTIEVNGAQVTKREFMARRNQAIEEAKARAKTKFEARRKAFLDGERAKLEEANKKVRAEIDRLIAEDAAANK
jgi:hypothetical protein